MLIEEGIETVQWQKGGRAAKGCKCGKGKSKGGKLVQEVEGELASLKEQLAAMKQSIAVATESASADNAASSSEGFAAAGDTELQGALNSARGEPADLRILQAKKRPRTERGPAITATSHEVAVPAPVIKLNHVQFAAIENAFNEVLTEMSATLRKQTEVQGELVQVAENLRQIVVFVSKLRTKLNQP